MTQTTNRVLLIGWDAADWQIITPLLDAGEMPALQSLIERGVMGNIATLDPPFSPMLWTSVATGHTADRHGVVHFVQPTEDATSARPVLGSSRRTKALWNILSQEGLRSNVVGWWPSHPAEPIRGTMVSNFFHPASAPVSEPWVAPPGTVHPPELEDQLSQYRVHPGELTGELIQPFIPTLADIDQSEDKRPARVAKMLADATSVHAVATYLMDTTEWDFTAVYYDSIDHFGHGFMQYHPPQMAKVSDDDFRHYQHVTRAAYRFHDMMLDRLLQLAGEDCTVILLSDHGFHSDHLRPTNIPKVPGGPAIEHRPLGVLCMAGPGIKRDERVYGASLLHIAPTVLTMFGLPVGADMAMPPLLDAFEEAPQVSQIPSWDAVEGDAGMHPPDAAIDPWSGQEAIRQLVELGYIDPTAQFGVQAAKQAAIDSAFNLGRVYLSTGRPALAVESFQDAYDGSPSSLPYYGLWLAQAYVRAQRYEDAGTLVRDLTQRDSTLKDAGAVILAEVALAQGRAEDALDALRSSSSNTLTHLLKKGTALLALHRFDEADDAFQTVLDSDPDNVLGHHGRAKVAIGQRRYQDAWHHALEAVSRTYHYPEAHFHLGVALARTGWLERAEQAFLVALSQNPTLGRARWWLAQMYDGPLNRPEDAAAQRAAVHKQAERQSD